MLVRDNEVSVLFLEDGRKRHAHDALDSHMQMRCRCASRQTRDGVIACCPEPET